MIKVNINYDRCRDVIVLLDKYYQNKDYLAAVEYPSNIIYKSNEYYLYMFYSCLLDYGMRSKIYHHNLIETYWKYPSIFNPNYVVTMSEKELKDILVSHVHPRYPNVAVKKWMMLSKSLLAYPNLVDYLNTFCCFQDLNDFIKSISGYGQKTGGLLIRIIYDSGICNFRENLKSIPIDRHDIEISYFTGIIDSKKLNEKDIQVLSDIYILLGEELNIRASVIDKYLWEVGNSFCNKKKCSECPLKVVCCVSKIDK